MTNAPALDIRCNGCGLTPDKIPDTVSAAEAEGMSPQEYVRILEPTYNEATGHFLCTDCYLETGIKDPAYRAP
jgi:hypothetical protein